MTDEKILKWMGECPHNWDMSLLRPEQYSDKRLVLGYYKCSVCGKKIFTEPSAKKIDMQFLFDEVVPRLDSWAMVGDNKPPCIIASATLGKSYAVGQADTPQAALIAAVAKLIEGGE